MLPRDLDSQGHTTRSMDYLSVVHLTFWYLPVNDPTHPMSELLLPIALVFAFILPLVLLRLFYPLYKQVEVSCP